METDAPHPSIPEPSGVIEPAPSRPEPVLLRALPGELPAGHGARSASLDAHGSIRAALNAPRPRRGSPEQTRARLIQTAVQTFNTVPYWETDTNQIAKSAGYSTGTFYRHFKDKREVFIAAYREWVAEEWASIESQVVPGLTPGESIDRAADALIAHHQQYRVFRGNLRALITYDDDLRALTHSLRHATLEKMSRLRRMLSGEERETLELDAIHAMMFERVCDAIADGEFVALGCEVSAAQAEFRRLMRQYLLSPALLAITR